MDSKTYYDTYLKKHSNDGLCLNCNKPTRYYDINRGYSSVCSRSCGQKCNWKAIKNNPIRRQHYTDVVSNNQAEIWKNRRLTGEEHIIRKKMAATNKNRISRMSISERKQKFGWLNHVNPKDRPAIIARIMDKSLFKFWREATSEQITAVRNKRFENCLYKHDLNDRRKLNLRTLNAYYKAVIYYTNKSYLKYKKDINSLNLPRGYHQYQLDHKYSVSQGFRHHISPKIIGDRCNLQMLYWKTNSSKNYKCSITKKELIEAYEKTNEQ